MSLFRSFGSFRLIVAVILLLMAALMVRFPAHNGDLPFYIAAAYSAQGLNDSAALAASATEIRTSLPAEKAARPLQDLGAAPPRFLDFYRIKAGYTGSVILFHRLGFSYVTATVIPSVIAFLFLGWAVFLWCARIFQGPQAVFIVFFLLATTGALVLGRISTPDAVTHSLLFWAIYRIRFGMKFLPTLVCLFLSLFFRLDNLPAVVGLIVMMRYFSPVSPVSPDTPRAAGSRLSTPALLCALVIAAVCCIAVNAWSEPRFWWFRPVPYPGVVQARDPLQNLHFVLAIARGPLPVLLALAAILSRFPRPSRAVTALLIYLAAMLPVRYIMFPHYEDRFFVAYYLAGFCTLLGAIIIGRQPAADSRRQTEIQKAADSKR